MNDTIDFEQARKKYRPADESPEPPETDENRPKEPSFDEIRERFGIIFTEDKSLYTNKFAGVPYEEQTVNVILNEDGTILPVITRDVMPLQNSMTGYNVPAVIIDGKEYYSLTCHEYHPLIVSRNPDSGQTTIRTPLIDSALSACCIYGHIICSRHSYTFDSTGETVCVEHIRHYSQSLLIRANYKANKDLVNRFMGLVGLRRPVIKQRKKSRSNRNRGYYGRQR